MERFIRAGAILFALVLGTGFVLFQTGDLESVLEPVGLFAGVDPADEVPIDSVMSHVERLDSADRIWLDSLVGADWDLYDRPENYVDVITILELVKGMARSHARYSDSPSDSVRYEDIAMRAARVLDALRRDSASALRESRTILDSAQMAWVDSLGRAHPRLAGHPYTHDDLIQVVDSIVRRMDYRVGSSKVIVISDHVERRRLHAILSKLRLIDSLENTSALIPDTSEAPEIIIPSSKVMIMPNLFSSDSTELSDSVESSDTSAKTGAPRK